jgi:hypothetical protein
MTNNCLDCKFIKDCKIYENCNGFVDFCDGCKDENDCTIKVYCEKGYAIQCNNGYEPKEEL